MPLHHALETVRAVLIGRLDERLEDIVAVVEKLSGRHVPDAGTRRALAVGIIQEIQLGMFPEEFADDPDGYPWPEDGGRMVREREELRWSVVKVLNDDGTTTRKRMAEMVTLTTPRPSGGLVPRHSLMAVYAKHLLEKGQQSPAASLTMPDRDGKPAPLFTDADLAELGRRIERRELAAAV
jgi:hypothetical protein